MSIFRLIGIALLAFLTCPGLATRAFADDVGVSGSVYLNSAYALTSVQGTPPGFSSSELAPPIVVGVDVDMHGHSPVDAWADLHLGTAQYGLDPLFGGAFGLGVHALPAGVPIELRGGLALEDQATLSQAPVGGSYLDNWRWGLIVSGEMSLGWVTPFAAIKWWNTPKAQLADFEDLSTEIGWNDSYSFIGGARFYVLPLVILEARLGYHSLGAVAIASKEFAYFIGQQPVLQPGIGVGVPVGQFEFWARYSRAFPIRNDDDTEYLYQAPYYYNDDLMNRSLLSMEVRWKF